MKKAAIMILGMGLLLSLSGTDLMADITVEIKSSISGIPFVRMLEMNQTLAVRGLELVSNTEGEFGVGDTSMAFLTGMYLNVEKNLIRTCDWRDSTCINIDLAELGEMFNSGRESVFYDSLMPYLKQAAEYIDIQKTELLETGNSRKIMGYQCRELTFNFEGQGKPPMDKMSGNIKFKINGSSWITDDFPRADEYKNVMGSIRDSLMTPAIEGILVKILDAFGIEPGLLDKYLEIWQYLFVETAMNIVVEVWSEGMDVPSMSFNIKFNSVLVDISFDKIPDSVFQPPPGMQIKDVDLQQLLK